MSGHVSHDMQMSMEKSIISYKAAEEATTVRSIDSKIGPKGVSSGPSRTRWFRSYAAKLATGLTPIELQTGSDLASYLRSEYLVLHGNEAQPAGGLSSDSRHKIRRERLLGFVTADIRQVGSLVPEIPIATKLIEAFKMDMQWKATGFHGDMETLMQYAIDVPVARSTSPIVINPLLSLKHNNATST